MSRVTPDQLRDGQVARVRGKILFSRLSSLITGKALEKRIEAARKIGHRYPTTVPHIVVIIADAQVVYANPSAPTPEEVYLAQKLRPIARGRGAGTMGFNFENRRKELPVVMEQDPESPGSHRPLVLEQDLAHGLDVTIVLEAFTSRKYKNKGLMIRHIVLNEPVRYHRAEEASPPASGSKKEGTQP